MILLVSPASATVFIETVPVGNAGNAGHLQLFGRYGGVAYEYRIGTYEVTIGQYTAFLNAVAATDTYGLYNEQMATNLAVAGIARTGPAGSYSYSAIGSPNKPVTYVSWADAARFSNWLHNGQPTGLQDAATTEDGAYALHGATTDAQLAAVVRSSGATWFIPSEDEWFKAAYHKNDGATGNYWAYPSRSDYRTFSAPPPGSGAPLLSNTANLTQDDRLANGYDDGYAVTGSSVFDPNQNYLTDVGAYTAAIGPYGTFDQAGNVSEWNEALSSGTLRSVRGGSYFSSYTSTILTRRDNYQPTWEFSYLGFRVATVPEPGTMTLAVAGMAMAWTLRKLWRQRSPRRD